MLTGSGINRALSLKVEMFGVTADETGGESAQLLDEFVSLQKEMFTALELHYRLARTATEGEIRPNEAVSVRLKG